MITLAKRSPKIGNIAPSSAHTKVPSMRMGASGLLRAAIRVIDTSWGISLGFSVFSSPATETDSSSLCILLTPFPLDDSFLIDPFEISNRLDSVFISCSRISCE